MKHPDWFTKLAAKIAKRSTAHHKGQYVQSVTVADVSQVLALLSEEFAIKPARWQDDVDLEYVMNNQLADHLYELGAKRKAEAATSSRQKA